MRGMRKTHDCIIVGAGLAGATAAEALSVHGRKILVLEARERSGGRGFSRSFGNSGEVVDFGGSWVTPWHHRIRARCATYGIALRPRHPVMERRWFRDGALHRDGPVAAGDRAAHESALARMAAHSALLKSGVKTDHHGFEIADKSLSSYLDAINAPQATRDLVSAWWTVSGNGDKTRVPASEFLHSIAYWDGTPDGMCEVWADTLVGSVHALAAKMLAASGAEILHEAPVARIAHGDDGVSVTLKDGRVFAAQAAILATGLNPLGQIVFDPPLPGLKKAGQDAGHLGRAVKIWAKIEGVPVGIVATGGGSGIEWMFTERATPDGGALAVGFGVAANGYVPDMPADIEAAVARFFPEGRLLAWDWHDWNGDDFSRGTWVAAILGQPQLHDAETWSPIGRLAFASSDIATDQAGWFEAAIISGETAAADVAAAIASRQD